MKKRILLLLPAIFFSLSQAWAFGGGTDPGARIYQQRCAMCHGPDGRGNDRMALDFRQEWHALNKSDEELAAHIRNGYRSPRSTYTSGGCPSQVINDRDLRDVLDYMRNEFLR